MDGTRNGILIERINQQIVLTFNIDYVFYSQRSIHTVQYVIQVVGHVNKTISFANNISEFFWISKPPDINEKKKKNLFLRIHLFIIYYCFRYSPAFSAGMERNLWYRIGFRFKHIIPIANCKAEQENRRKFMFICVQW